jgi:DtxR family Mn-dependent transcriptional regulator
VQRQPGDDYLDAIYELESNGLSATTSALANQLGVAQASVSEMLRRLAERGMVSYEPYKPASLTDKGRRRGAQLARRHRLWETFLASYLGIEWTRVFKEACELEHATSDLVLQRLDEFLGHPTVCPHGLPIPDPDGNVPDQQVVALTELKVGQRGEIAFIATHEGDVLSYLDSLGLVPGTGITLEARAPFDGPLSICAADELRVLGRKLAELVQVSLTKGSRSEPQMQESAYEAA